MLALLTAFVTHAIAAPAPVVDAIEWRSEAPRAGSDRVRWRPHVRGLPVLDRAESRRRGDDRPLMFAFQGSTDPTLTDDEAVAASGLRARHVELAVSGGHDRLVYDVHGEDDAGRAARVWVDAEDGRVLRFIPMERHAHGLAYVDSDGTIDEVDLGDLDGEGDLLANDQVVAFSAPVVDGERMEVALAAPGRDRDFLYEPEDEAFAEVNAFYWTNRWLEELDTFHDFQPSKPVIIRANYTDDDGQPYPNASMLSGGDEWEMRFGAGPDGDFAHDPHIVVHELTHGVTSDLAGFQDIAQYPYNTDYRGQDVAPNALTEGLADYFAASVLDDSLMGRTTGLAERELDDPDLTCFDTVGEAHFDGLVVGATTWSLREQLGRDLTDDLVFRSTERLSDSPTFPGWARALRETAADLVAEGRMTAAEEQVVDDEIAHRHLDECGRTVELTEGHPVTQRVHGWDLYGEQVCEGARRMGARLPLAYLLEVPVPADAKRLFVDLTWTDRADGGAATNLDYEVRVSDSPDMVQPRYIEGLAFAAAEPPTSRKVKVYDDNPSSVEIKRVSKHDTMYVTVVANNCTDADLTVSVTPSDKGCGGCSATGPLSGSVGGLMLLTLAGLRRRF